MIRKSLSLLKQSLSRARDIIVEDHRLSDSYQLSESEIAQILNQPAISPTAQSTQPATTESEDLVYQLPKKNTPFPLVYDEEDLRQIAETPTQNLYHLLEIHKESTFQSYLDALKTSLHNEVDLYGDAVEQKSIDISTLEFKDLIKTNSQYLLFLRKKYLVNPNLPGTIQLEDANTFLDLRPVEDFRHTPLVPISESAMKKFKQQMEQRHSKAFYFSVKTQSLINVGLFIVAIVVVGTLLSQVRKGSDKKALEVMRTKHQRLTGEY